MGKTRPAPGVTTSSDVFSPVVNFSILELIPWPGFQFRPHFLVQARPICFPPGAGISCKGADTGNLGVELPSTPSFHGCGVTPE